MCTRKQEAQLYGKVQHRPFFSALKQTLISYVTTTSTEKKAFPCVFTGNKWSESVVL